MWRVIIGVLLIGIGGKFMAWLALAAGASLANWIVMGTLFSLIFGGFALGYYAASGTRKKKDHSHAE